MEHPLETEKSKQWIIKEPLSGLYSNGPVFDFGQQIDVILIQCSCGNLFLVCFVPYYFLSLPFCSLA